MVNETRPGPVNDLTTLYRDTIVKHAVNPVGFEQEIHATHRKEIFNPLCGDRVEVQLRLEGESVEAMAFSGEACAICLASASLMCENLPACSAAELEQMQQQMQIAMEEDQPTELPEAFVPLLGVRAYPSRVRCALLPWEAAVGALEE